MRFLDWLLGHCDHEITTMQSDGGGGVDIKCIKCGRLVGWMDDDWTGWTGRPRPTENE